MELIESVGSEHLLEAIEAQAAKLELVQDILLEVNIGGEASKSGISPEELSALAAQAVGSPMCACGAHGNPSRGRRAGRKPPVFAKCVSFMLT